ncbi:LLM class flavin-dependent oxidoreductase [Rhodococcoides yunnanense]|uniref:LLM class flavin-dependent oxidoreductase n=1 Tax=Rhodococcoides yunnanense TaxID=278209 RepID=UPI0009335568|nr:LLM class flavin-dependent oxidoreductase [Rhodococcus yunnanensis]
MSNIVEQHLGFGAGGVVRVEDTTELLDLAQSADELGFDIFTLSDHLHGDRFTFDPWTALSWLAGKTRRIELGTNVLGLPYRAPAVLAKSAETLDRVSNGRLVLGLGAGGYDHEFDAFGLVVRTPGEKIVAQREAIEILRSLWTDPTTTVAGEQYSVVGARITPQPSHRIPIWLGSYGPRALELTGQVADGWLPSLGRIDLRQASDMRAKVRAAALAAGRDPDSITCATNATTRIDRSATSSPGLITGSVPRVIEQLVEIVEAGFTMLLLGPQTTAQQKLLAAEVLPAVRVEVAARGLISVPAVDPPGSRKETP